jgi:citronellol/citronellal dehydrogenase
VAATPFDVFRPGLFAGSRVLITGGGTGIGRAAAELFVSLGAAVFIGSRKEEKVRPAAEALSEGAAHPVGWATVDIRDPERVGAFVDAAIAHMGGIDVLVNNAGGQFPSPAEAYSPNGWDAVIRNNLHGTWYMTQAVANRWMIPNGGGSVINVVANIWRGMPGIAHTGAARAGVVNLAKSLAIEWARHRIRVNCVAPGVIATEGLQVYPPEVIREISSKIPLKRMGTAAETAAAIAFLASPAGAYFTGATLAMDGGQALWGDMWVIPDPGDDGSS